MRTEVAGKSVSIITPTHNRIYSIKRLIASLEKQDYPFDKIEHIVVCDGCKDGTAAYLAGCETRYRLRYVELEGKGAAAARNAGAALAKGELLIFLDDDIEPSAGLVKAFVDQCATSWHVVIGYLPMQVRDQAGYNDIHLSHWWEHKFYTMGYPGYRFTYEDLLSGSFALHRELFEQLGGFNTKFRCREDYELGYRLLKSGAKFSFSREAWGYHRDEVTDLRRLMQRKKLEGYWDVEMARLHPELVPLLSLNRIQWLQTEDKWLRILAFSWPRLGDRLAQLAFSMLGFMEARHLRSPWQNLENRLKNYWYMRGVAGHVGNWKTLGTLTVDKVDPTIRHRLLDSHAQPLKVPALQQQSEPYKLLHYVDRFFHHGLPVVDVAHWPGWERMSTRQLQLHIAEQRYAQYYGSKVLQEQQVPGLHRKAVGINEPLGVEGYQALIHHLSRLDLKWRIRQHHKNIGKVVPVSVVVCTRDRTNLLRDCIRAIQDLDYPAYEIIVVDNAPNSDATEKLCSAMGVRYVREDKPGLDNARNCGIRSAVHEIIAFTDDDARVDKRWLQEMIIHYKDPEVMAVTGYVAPLSLSTPAQKLFEYNYGGMGHGFRKLVYDGKKMSSREKLSASRMGVGANMSFRKIWFARGGYFDPVLDVGTPSSGGGDIEMFHRVVSRNAKLVYAPGMLVWHLHREQISGLNRQIFNNGRSFFCYLAICFNNRSVGRKDILFFFFRDWIYGWFIRYMMNNDEWLSRRLLLQEIRGLMTAPLALYATLKLAREHRS